MGQQLAQTSLHESESSLLYVVELLEQVASMVEARGCPVKPYSKKSLSIFAAWPADKKENLIKKLQTTIRIILASTEIEKVNPSKDYTERRLVETALDFYGYELRDEEFWKTITKGEMLEVYNAENIQIFRTFNFFRTSSYSLLDLLVNEWFNLWERPTGTLDNMFKVVAALFSGEIKGITRVGVPEHVINEIFNAEDQEKFLSRSSLCKFGVICPIYNKSDGRIGGLLVSGLITPLGSGELVKNISFI